MCNDCHSPGGREAFTADLLLGYPTSSGRSPSAPEFYHRMKEYDAYAQDDSVVTIRAMH